MLYLAWDREINISLFFCDVFVWKWGPRPQTSSRCCHGNKSAANFEKRIFVHPPECLTVCKIWRGVENFYFLRCLILIQRLVLNDKNYVVDPLYFFKDLNPLTPKVSYKFGEFGIRSTNNNLIEILLYSHHFYAWYCIDIVRRNSLLVTHGSSFVSLQGAWRMGESVKEIKLVSGDRLRIQTNTIVDGHAREDQFLSTVR